jgi:hypothetical protein
MALSGPCWQNTCCEPTPFLMLRFELPMLVEQARMFGVEIFAHRVTVGAFRMRVPAGNYRLQRASSGSRSPGH